MEVEEVLEVLKEISDFYVGAFDDEEGYGRRHLFEYGELDIEYIEDMNRIVISFFKRVRDLNEELPSYCHEEVDSHHNINCEQIINLNGLTKQKLKKLLEQKLCEMQRLFRKL